MVEPRDFRRFGARAALVLSLACVTVGLAPSAASAAEAPAAASDPALEARVMALAAELRCLVCQNQTIADSHADLAVDLRNQIRDMLAQGRSERDVMDYMTARYGDFVRYRPPLQTNTLLLWGAPGVLLVVAVASLLTVLRRRQRMDPSAFEPDAPAADEGAADAAVPTDRGVAR